VFRTLLEVHPAEADANSAGRDNDNAVAILVQLYGGFDYERKNGEEGLVCLLVDDATRACTVSAQLFFDCGVLYTGGAELPSLMTTVSWP
jgi:hypothetical protein